MLNLTTNMIRKKTTWDISYQSGYGIFYQGNISCPPHYQFAEQPDAAGWHFLLDKRDDRENGPGSGGP